MWRTPNVGKGLMLRTVDARGGSSEHQPCLSADPLPTACRQCRLGGNTAGRGVQRQRRSSARAAHELHAHTNKHAEKWLSRREDFEAEFKWDGTTTCAVLILGIGLPIATYNMLVWRSTRACFAGD